MYRRLHVDPSMAETFAALRAEATRLPEYQEARAAAVRDLVGVIVTGTLQERGGQTLVLLGHCPPTPPFRGIGEARHHVCAAWEADLPAMRAEADALARRHLRLRDLEERIQQLTDEAALLSTRTVR